MRHKNNNGGDHADIDAQIKLPADTVEIPVSPTDRREGDVWIHPHQLQAAWDAAGSTNVVGAGGEYCIVSIVPLRLEEFVL